MTDALVYVDDWARSVRTDANADEIDTLVEIEHDFHDDDPHEFPLWRTADDWSRELEAHRIMLGLAPALQDAFATAVPDGQGNVTVEIDEETALHLLTARDDVKQ